MADPSKLTELDQRIATVRENMRVLTKQATDYSGAEGEGRNADRIADQDALLTRLLVERAALTGMMATNAYNRLAISFQNMPKANPRKLRGRGPASERKQSRSSS